MRKTSRARGAQVRKVAPPTTRLAAHGRRAIDELDALPLRSDRVGQHSAASRSEVKFDRMKSWEALSQPERPASVVRQAEQYDGPPDRSAPPILRPNAMAGFSTTRPRTAEKAKVAAMAAANADSP